MRTAAHKRPELPLPQTLPAATIVIANAPRARVKQRGFYRIQMGLWNVEAEFVHA
jgi:hypothetical protein